MSVKELKQKIYSSVDMLSYKKMVLIADLLSMMTVDEETLTIETDLTDEERKLIQDDKLEFENHPENFVNLSDIIAERKSISI
jgi:Tat protein secretion system quality control protein TatD with DNase activity